MTVNKSFGLKSLLGLADSSVKGTLVANYVAQAGSEVICSLIDFEGNTSEGSTPFNVLTGT